MKKNTNLSVSLLSSLFFILFITHNVYAIDYTITFSGSGASTSVDSVIVHNLTQGKSIKVPQGYQLNLTDVTAVEEINADNEFISIIPNPITDKSVISFYSKQSGNTHINVVGLDGKNITKINFDLPEGKNSFQLSLPKGVYLVQAKGNGFSYSTKAISLSLTDKQPMIHNIGNTPESKLQKVTASVVKMQYAAGDQILYKGYSGNFCTFVTDKPIGTKSTDFKFADCTDADGNHYPIVYIGNQTWMAENLKTTKYRTGVEIGTTTPANKDISGETDPKYQWAYNGDENNAMKYGRLYTWHAVVDNRNIAPEGWHVPTDTEWTTLENYLIANGFNYDGSTTGNKIAKSMAANTDWTFSRKDGVTGSTLTKNNSCGFTALPGGNRNNLGTFYDIEINGYWRSSTEFSTTYAWTRYIYYNSVVLSRINNFKSYGYSVRCIKD